MTEVLHRPDPAPAAAAAVGERRVTVLRTVQEVAAARDRWQALPWGTFEADQDIFLAVIDARADALRPHVILVERDGEIEAALVGRLERVPLECRFGYKVVYRPTVRSITVVHGGLVGAEDEALARLLLGALERSLAAGEADVASLPSIRSDTPFFRLATTTPGLLRRQHFAEPRMHHKLELPESLDALLAPRSRKARYNIKRYNDIFERAFPEELRLEVLRSSEDARRIIGDLEHVAAKTYQRGLGVGFVDRDDHRRLVEVGLARRLVRVLVLYRGREPIAFWLGYVHNRTFFSSATSFDPAYSEYRPGAYLQLKLIEHLCADPDVDALDYGLGDADYKRRFATESWEESDAAIFAPRLRGLQVNLAQTAIQGSAWLARRVLEQTGLTDRVKRAWRSRLRPDADASSQS
jgi:CelD/BcsL family acetyltransferase involved in cellulose biosynthesis